MLTIDYLDEGNLPAEKPNHRTQPVVYRKAPGTVDWLYAWARGQQQSLVQAAHNARLLKLAKDGTPSADLQRNRKHCWPGLENLSDGPVHHLG